MVNRVTTKNLKFSLITFIFCRLSVGFVGIQIGTHINDWNLDAEELTPVFEVCEVLHAHLFD